MDEDHLVFWEFALTIGSGLEGTGNLSDTLEGLLQVCITGEW
jgi:hypothetical protein